MSEQNHPNPALPRTDEPVHVAARRLRWFRAAFESVRTRIETDTGLVFDVDELRLGECFVAWLKKVEAGNPHANPARRAYFEHAAGMMLRELITTAPLTLLRRPEEADSERPEYFWPEGFCYTVFCMNVFAAALRQEFGVDAERGAEFSDLRTWWSFRENVGHDSAYSVAFFKLFTGSEPNWQMPDVFRWDDRDRLPFNPVPTIG